MKIAAAAAFFVAIAAAAPAVARQHAVRPPVSDARPAGWLTNHAFRDVAAIGPLVGPANVVALGDDTHGTHEFFETKIEMIETLMATDDFRTVAFEAPFPEFNRLNDYILGGEGDPRAILLGNRELGYWMWATEEVVDLVEWMRAYNANRGDKPPLEITGFDVADPKGSADLVLAYLNSADPVAAANASATYTACVPQFSLSDCQSRLNAVRDDLQNREDDLASRSSQRAFDVALQAASIVAAWPTQPNPYFAWRDDNMATNVERLQERRSSNGRIILWGHQEHLGKTINLQGSKPTGAFLAEHYGANYFVVGSSAGDGRFNVVDPNVFVTTARFPPMTSDDFESDFRSAAQPLLLIPLRGIALPQWLSSTRHLRVGSSNAAMDAEENLAQKLDAIVYVDQTSRTESFW